MAGRDPQGYDYNHATMNTQFIALIVIIAMIAGSGLTLGLAALTAVL